MDTDLTMNEVCCEELSLNELDEVTGGFLPLAAVALGILVGGAVAYGVGYVIGRLSDSGAHYKQV
jgi:lactobin A/cerein 7B family class IIb bacteriocin